MTIKISREVNLWSILATVVSVASLAAYMQGDIKALQTEDTRFRGDLSRMEGVVTRRLDQSDERSQRDRETILIMQGDIRVIRQILEGVRGGPPGPAQGGPR